MFRSSFRKQHGATAQASVAVSQPSAMVLDVRTPEEFAQGHVPGARNLPVQELAQRFTELGADKHVDIIVYCRSGARSALAARMLVEQGFTRVTDIGSINNWRGPGAHTG